MSGPTPIETLEESPRWVDRRINPAYLAVLVTISIGGLTWLLALTAKDATQDTTLGNHEKKIETIEKNNREDAKAIQEKLDLVLIELGRRK